MRSCDICGKAMTEGSVRRYYCSDECARAAKRARNKVYARERRMREEQEKAKPKPNGKRSELSRIAALAKAAGMSYGQYVAATETPMAAHWERTR